MLIGEATIKIDADTIGLKKQVSDDLNDALGGIRPPVDPIKKTKDEADKAGKSIDKLIGGFNGLAAGAGRTFLSVMKVAGGFASMSTAANVIPAIVAGIATLSGAMFLAVPAGFALAGVMATIKLGGEGAKRAFDRLNPTLDQLKSKVSTSFELSLNPAVNNLRTVLPKLTSGFQQIASAIGGVATKVSIMLKTNAATSQLQAILSGTSRVVQNLGAALAPVIAAFIKIGATAMPILIQLTAGAGAAGDKFNALIQRMADSGSLTAWIQSALDGFRAIGAVLGDLGAILKAVFNAVQAAGGGLGGVLGEVIGRIREFVESAQGQAVLTALVTAINAISTALGTVLTAALDAIGPAIPDLVSAFSQLIAIITPTIVAIIVGLAGAFQSLAQFLAENMNWLGPIAVTVLALIGAFKIFVTVIAAIRAAIVAWSIVQGVLNVLLTANPVGVIIVAIGALIALIVIVLTNLEFFRGVWDTVWKFVSDVVTDVVDAIKDAWGALTSWLSGVIDSIGNFFKDIGNWFAELPGKIGSFLAGLPAVIGNALLAAMQWGLNAIYEGIQWYIAAMIALPLRIIEAIVTFGPMLFNWAVDAFIWLVNAVVQGIANVITFFQELPGKIISAVINFAVMMAEWARGAFIAFINMAVTKAAEFIIWVRALPGRIVEGIKNLGSLLATGARNHFNAFLDGAKQIGQNLLDWVKGIPRWIVDRLGDLGNLLLGAGKAIIQGLLNGIKNAVKGVFDFVGGIADKIKSLKGPLSYDRDLLIPAGNAIMQGLHEGLADRFARVLQFVRTVAPEINRAIVTQAGSLNIGGKIGTDDRPDLQAEDGTTVPASFYDKPPPGYVRPQWIDDLIVNLKAQAAARDKALAEELTKVQVVVSASEANSQIKKVQTTDERRR